MKAKKIDSDKLLLRISRDVKESYDRSREMGVSDSALRAGSRAFLVSGQTFLDIVAWRMEWDAARKRRNSVRHGKLKPP